MEPSHGSGIFPSHGLAPPEAMANAFAPPPDDYDFGAFDISHDHDHHEQQTNDDVMSEPEAVARPTPRVIRADFSRLWMSLFAWFYHFRVSRAAFAALLAILAHFTLFLVATSNLFSSDGGTYPGDDDVVFPSMHRLDKYTGMSRHNDDDFFRKLVACPKCMSVYEPTNLPRQCTYIRFPHHRQATFRAACGAVLADFPEARQPDAEHPASRATREPTPKLIFPYKSIQERLQELFSTPTFALQCEQWRSMSRVRKHWSDVYDGSLWDDMQNDQGPYGDFLADPGNLALMLNLDWFNPFTRFLCCLFLCLFVFTSLLCLIVGVGTVVVPSISPYSIFPATSATKRNI